MDLWDQAQQAQGVHRFSTLFAAPQVKTDFDDPAKIDQAIAWCKATAVTKVYVESYRDAVEVPRETLLEAKRRFEAAGIAVSGCVTPTKIGKPSTRWSELISCYTDLPTQERVKGIFARAAAVFDEIMIDDFWFTDCACPACNDAREARTVRVGTQTFPVDGDAWDQYRRELLVQVSRACVLRGAKEANVNAKLIIKYPQWYERFHLRGYDVIRESADFDRTWAGTETRDYPVPFVGCVPQYEAFFVMRWLLGIAPEKCGGGWYDPFGTTEHTYVEQARQTILGGARESMLFSYDGLQRGTGPRNVEVLREHIPELLRVAREVGTRTPIGVAAYKPANSDGHKEPFVFDFLGMIGIPLLPCHEFPADAPAAFLSTHALSDAELVRNLSRYISHVRPVLLTEGLADRLPRQVDVGQHHVRTLAIKGDPASLLELPQPVIDSIRAPLLEPLGYTLEAPSRVAFYPFTDGSWVLESFNDRAVRAELNGEAIDIAPRGWVCRFRTS
jgi:hypothetical protein